MVKIKNKISVAAMLLAAGVLLTGCGTKLHVMTNAERDMIVAYSAEVVSKYNIYQKDGLQAVDERALQERQQALAAQDADSNVYVEEHKPAEMSTDIGAQENAEETLSANAGINAAPVDIARALQMPETVSISYQGVRADTVYQTAHSAVTAQSGNTFVIAEFQMSATEDVQLNMMEKNPTFELGLQGETYPGKVTLMAAELSSFMGTVRAGESRTVIAMFEVPQEKAADLSDISMSVKIGEKTSLLAL